MHTYLFHTSILFANRQIYHESSNVFYLENLFVRVNAVTSGPFFDFSALAAKEDHGHLLPLPIFINESKVQACTRHVMEIDLFPRSSSVLQERKLHFILAADDLPLLCRRLLWTDVIYTDKIGILQQTELWIIVGDEVLNASAYEKSAECLNAATKNASASRGERPTYRSRKAIEGSACTGEETNSNRINKFKLSRPSSPFSKPQLRRLLEPLRALHSIGSSYIDAAIGKRYRKEIQTSLFRARPGIQDLFPILVSAYEEAMATFEAGYYTLAVQQLRGTLDIWNEITYLYTADVSTKLATGPFAGSMLQRALRNMRYDLYKALIRALLTDCEYVQRKGVGKILAERILESYSRKDHWGQKRYDTTALALLVAEMWEVLDQLGVHDGRPTSQTLRIVISMLTGALQHEPSNTTLPQVLKRIRRAKVLADSREGIEGDVEGRG